MESIHLLLSILSKFINAIPVLYYKDKNFSKYYTSKRILVNSARSDTTGQELMSWKVTSKVVKIFKKQTAKNPCMKIVHIEAEI